MTRERRPPCVERVAAQESRVAGLEGCLAKTTETFRESTDAASVLAAELQEARQINRNLVQRNGTLAEENGRLILRVAEQERAYKALHFEADADAGLAFADREAAKARISTLERELATRTVMVDELVKQLEAADQTRLHTPSLDPNRAVSRYTKATGGNNGA